MLAMAWVLPVVGALEAVQSGRNMRLAADGLDPSMQVSDGVTNVTDYNWDLDGNVREFVQHESNRTLAEVTWHLYEAAQQNTLDHELESNATVRNAYHELKAKAFHFALNPGNEKHLGAYPAALVESAAKDTEQAMVHMKGCGDGDRVGAWFYSVMTLGTVSSADCLRKNIRAICECRCSSYWCTEDGGSGAGCAEFRMHGCDPGAPATPAPTPTDYRQYLVMMEKINEEDTEHFWAVFNAAFEQISKELKDWMNICDWWYQRNKRRLDMGTQDMTRLIQVSQGHAVQLQRYLKVADDNIFELETRQNDISSKKREAMDAYIETFKPFVKEMITEGYEMMNSTVRTMERKGPAQYKDLIRDIGFLKEDSDNEIRYIADGSLSEAARDSVFSEVNTNAVRAMAKRAQELMFDVDRQAKEMSKLIAMGNEDVQVTANTREATEMKVQAGLQTENAYQMGRLLDFAHKHDAEMRDGWAQANEKVYAGADPIHPSFSQAEKELGQTINNFRKEQLIPTRETINSAAAGVAASVSSTEEKTAQAAATVNNNVKEFNQNAADWKKMLKAEESTGYATAKQGLKQVKQFGQQMENAASRALADYKLKGTTNAMTYGRQQQLDATALLDSPNNYINSIHGTGMTDQTSGNQAVLVPEATIDAVNAMTRNDDQGGLYGVTAISDWVSNRAKALRPFVNKQLDTALNRVFDQGTELNTEVLNYVKILDGYHQTLSNMPAKMRERIYDMVDKMQATTLQNMDALRGPRDAAKTVGADLDAQIEKIQKDFGRDIKTRLEHVSELFTKVGRISNTDLPTLRQYLMHELGFCYDAITEIEQELKTSLYKTMSETANTAEEKRKAWQLQALQAVEHVEDQMDATRQERYAAVTNTKSATLGLERELQDTVKQTTKSAAAIATESEETTAELQKQRDAALTSFGCDPALTDCSNRVPEAGSSMDEMKKIEASAYEDDQSTQQKVKDAAVAAKAMSHDWTHSIAQDLLSLHKDAEQKANNAFSRFASETIQGGFQSNQDRVVQENVQMLAALDRAKEELRIFTAHAQGNSADEKEWAEKLKTELNGENAVHAQQKILEANDELAQKRAIEERFAKLTGIVNEKVHNLDAEKQQQIAKLLDEVKRETYLVAGNSQMTTEQQAERLAALEAWLTGQVQDITEDIHEGEVSFDMAEGSDKDFDKDTAQRIDDLRTSLQMSDASMGIVQDRDAVRDVDGDIGKVVKAAESRLDEMNAAFNSQYTTLDSMRTLQQEPLRVKAKAAADTFLDHVDSELQQEFVGLENVTDTVSKLEDGGAPWKQDLPEFEQKADDDIAELSKRLGTQTANRERRQLTLTSWLGNTVSHTATSLVNVAHVLVGLLDAADEHAVQQGADVEKRMQTLAQKSSSEDYLLLKSLHDADENLDTIGENNKMLLEWAQDHHEGMGNWRKHLVKQLGTVGVDLSKELGEIQAGTKHFAESLASAEQQSEGDAAKFITDTEHEEEDAVDHANQAAMATIGRLESVSQNADADAKAELAREQQAADEDMKQATADSKALAAEVNKAAQEVAATSAAADAAKKGTNDAVEEGKAAAKKSREQLTQSMYASGNSGVAMLKPAGLLLETGASVSDDVSPRARSALLQNAALTTQHGHLLQELRHAMEKIAPQLPERARFALVSNMELSAQHARLVKELEHATMRAHDKNAEMRFNSL